MKLFKKRKKVKVLKALKDFDAIEEGYKVRKGEHIFITDDNEYHKILFITKDRAKKFIEKRIGNDPIVEEVEI